MHSLSNDSQTEPLCPYIPQVQDEAVPFVEAAPAKLHLFGSDVPLAFDLVQPLDRTRTGLSSPKTRLHSSFLGERERKKEREGRCSLDHLKIHLTMLISHLHANFLSCRMAENFPVKHMRLEIVVPLYDNVCKFMS